MEKYEVITLVLWSLTIIFMLCAVTVASRSKYQHICFLVAILLCVASIYSAKLWDDNTLIDNTKKFEQQFKIKNQTKNI